MRSTFIFGLLLVFLFTTAGFGSSERVIRSVGGSGSPANDHQKHQVMGADANFDTLHYEDPAPELYNFMPIPNDFSDKYFNVRFTPLDSPFTLMEAHIPLFDMFGDPGEPDLKVIIWQSGEQDGEPGFPSEAIDSIIVPFEDLVFGGEIPVINIIDLSSLQISFNDIVDFHIGIDGVIRENSIDSVGIYFDEGDYTNESRSYLWNGEDEEWSNLNPLLSEELYYNYFIHAVVGANVGAPVVLKPETAPHSILINPAYPNPFNNQTLVNFSVPNGEKYDVRLFSSSGRLVKDISSGFGHGTQRLTFNAEGLTAGSYFLSIETQTGSSSTRLIYTR